MAFLALHSPPWIIASVLEAADLTALDLFRAAFMADEGGVLAAIIKGEVLFTSSTEGIHNV